MKLDLLIRDSYDIHSSWHIDNFLSLFALSASLAQVPRLTSQTKLDLISLKLGVGRIFRILIIHRKTKKNCVSMILSSV